MRASNDEDYTRGEEIEYRNGTNSTKGRVGLHKLGVNGNCRLGTTQRGDSDTMLLFRHLHTKNLDLVLDLVAHIEPRAILTPWGLKFSCQG